MIHFDPVPEPPGFDEEVRQPGNAWLQQHPDTERPRDFWSPFKPHLEAGFRKLCGYTAMLTTDGTVDHYLSCKNYPELTYEWRNYRFVSPRINSSKQDVDDRVLDPFQVTDGWFEILLPSLQLVMTDAVPADECERATFTLERLHLRDGETVIRQRREWYKRYEQGEMPLELLDKFAPLIARAVRKQMEAEVDGTHH
ncbi:MAG: hypothetical protein HC884_20060 [Chloroflexaceae bacterium]|nr:hypothetical protein [Chloroflexaceae bacterium]